LKAKYKKMFFDNDLHYSIKLRACEIMSNLEEIQRLNHEILEIKKEEKE
jgi:hypothetical protein